MAPFDEAAGVGAAALEALGDADLGALAGELREGLARDGIDFRSENGSTQFELDLVPRVIGGREWAMLEAGLAQRLRALNAFLADAYGPRRAVADGVLPARVIETAEGFEPQMTGVRPPGDAWAGIAGLDLVRGEDGEFRVLEDNLTTPSGFAYAVAAREAVLARLTPPRGREPLPLDGVAGMLGATLRAAAPEGGDPAIVVLTDGPDNSAYWEHAWVAEALSVPLVQPGDLELRGDRLLHDGRRVDVVYRRTNADRVDTEVGALLVPPLRAGTLGVVNAFGTMVADDKLAHAYVEDLVRYFCGGEPLLRSVETLDLGRPEQLERALDELERLVVKPRAGSGGDGVVICRDADPGELDELRRRLAAAPEDFVAQPLVEISLHPTVIDGALRPRRVDLRPFVFLRASTVEVMPGGLTRVALEEGARVVNSTKNGGAKDTWVVP
jgi:uncharacterized circularly permuted ATP-grasp superfamily protein